MPRVPFRRYIDPRRVNNFLDICAFDPNYSPEDAAAQSIRALHHTRVIQLSPARRRIPRIRTASQLGIFTSGNGCKGCSNGEHCPNVGTLFRRALLSQVNWRNGENDLRLRTRASAQSGSIEHHRKVSGNRHLVVGEVTLANDFSGRLTFSWISCLITNPGYS